MSKSVLPSKIYQQFSFKTKKQNLLHLMHSQLVATCWLLHGGTLPATYQFSRASSSQMDRRHRMRRSSRDQQRKDYHGRILQVVSLLLYLLHLEHLQGLALLLGRRGAGGNLQLLDALLDHTPACFASSQQQQDQHSEQCAQDFVPNIAETCNSSNSLICIHLSKRPGWEYQGPCILISSNHVLTDQETVVAS